jgi:preprotein translocase subunit SecD
MRYIRGMVAAAVLALAPAVAWAGESIVLHVQHASVVKDSADQPSLQLELTKASKDEFGAFTGRHVGEVVDFKVDGEVVMSPVVREPITGGLIMVSGQVGKRELASIAKRIEAAEAKVEAAVHEE